MVRADGSHGHFIPIFHGINSVVIRLGRTSGSRLPVEMYFDIYNLKANGHGSEREMYLADNVTYGFNEVLEFTAEMGILGLLLSVGVLFLVIRKWLQLSNIQNIQSFHFLGLGAMFTWLIFGLFSYPMSIPSLAIVLPVTLSGINTALINEKDKKKQITGSKRLNASIGITKNILSGLILLSITSYGIFWVNHYRPLSKLWMEVNDILEYSRNDVAHSRYMKLYPEFQNEGYFLQYAGKSCSLGREYYKSSQLLERSLFLSSDPVIFTTLGSDYTLFSKSDSKKKVRAEFLLKRARFISPNKLYPRFLLVKYYQKNEQFGKALVEAEMLLAITPKVSSPATKEIRLEIQTMVDQTFISPVLTNPSNIE